MLQDDFLEDDISNNRLTCAFTHISLRRNLGAPKEVPAKVMDPLLAADLDTVDLERQFKSLYI